MRIKLDHFESIEKDDLINFKKLIRENEGLNQYLNKMV